MGGRGSVLEMGHRVHCHIGGVILYCLASTWHTKQLLQFSSCGVSDGVCVGGEVEGDGVCVWAGAYM